jgi:hypothetical protein
MSHQVQLHLTVPTAVWTRPGTPLSHRPAAADVRTPPAGQDMCRILPTLADPICTGIFHTSAKDSRTSPRTGRQDQSARSCHDLAICPLALLVSGGADGVLLCIPGRFWVFLTSREWPYCTGVIGSGYRVAVPAAHVMPVSERSGGVLRRA